MPLVRFLVACLVALTCLGAGHAVAGGPISGKPSKPAGAKLVVEICFGDACGPKAFSGGRIGDSFPPIAKQAGTITASRPLSFRCPGTCEAASKRRVTVTIIAAPRRGGNTEFDHWERACERAGTARSCTVPVEGKTNVKAVFRRYSGLSAPVRDRRRG
jgi:hypothetical protein